MYEGRCSYIIIYIKKIFLITNDVTATLKKELSFLNLKLHNGTCLQLDNAYKNVSFTYVIGMYIGNSDTKIHTVLTKIHTTYPINGISI